MAAFWPIGTAQIIRIVSYPIRKKSRFWLFCMWSVKEMYHALLPKTDYRDKGRGHDRRLYFGPPTDSTNYRKSFSNFLLSWLTNRQWLFSSQSWGPEQGFRSYFAEALNQSLVFSVGQATFRRLTAGLHQAMMPGGSIRRFFTKRFK